MKPSDASRFWSKVRIAAPEDCWEWNGALRNGYGHAWVDMKLQYAHRVSWSWANGPIPSGMHILHRCDNPRCVNPGHLFIGTNNDNIADRISKGRGTNPGVPGERNHNAKINETTVRAIRSRAASGQFTHKQIANEFGLSRSRTSSVIRGIGWKHVPASQ